MEKPANAAFIHSFIQQVFSGPPLRAIFQAPTVEKVLSKDFLEGVIFETFLNDEKKPMM